MPSVIICCDNILLIIFHIITVENQTILMHNPNKKSNESIQNNSHSSKRHLMNKININYRSLTEKIEMFFSRKQMQTQLIDLAFQKIKIFSYINNGSNQSSKNSLYNKLQRIRMKFQSNDKIEGEQEEQSLNLQNKQLYLQYVENVLLRKQQQLLSIEKQLKNQKKQLAAKQYQLSISKSLRAINQAEIISKKLEMYRQNFIVPLLDPQTSETFHKRQKLSQMIKMQQKIVKQCNWNREISDGILREQFDKIENQKQELNKKIQYFEELQFYEKYLKEFEEVLNQKQTEINEKMDMLDQYTSKINMVQDSQQDISFKLKSSHKKSRRHKIFDKSNHDSSQMKFKDSQDYAENQSTIKLQENIPEVEAEAQSSLSNEKQAIVSKIYTQNSKSYLSNKFLSFNMKHESVKQANKLEIHTKTVGTQSNEQTVKQTQKRLRKQYLICKYLGLWMKLSGYCKGTFDHKKQMFFNRWKISACFDLQIPNKLSTIITVLDPYWQKRQKLLKNEKLFPYNKLSLKRKKYVQLLIENQRKVTHHRKIMVLLRSIIRNRGRKERLAFYLYWNRLVNNCRNLTMVSKCSTTKIETNIQYNDQTGLSKNPSKNNREQGMPSWVISKCSSNIMNEQLHAQGQSVVDKTTRKDLKNNKSSAKGLHSRSQVQLQSTPSKASMKKNKQNEKSIEKNSGVSSVDIKKLKQYIKAKEETERLLGIKCLRTESIYKMENALRGSICFSYGSFYQILKQKAKDMKYLQLEQRLTGYQFRWELFLTKIKLGLTNNTSKINQLEQLALLIEK